MFNALKLSLLLLVLGCTGTAFAQESEAAVMTAEQVEASLTYKTGKIALPGGLATLDLPAGFRYLSPADADRVLVQGWGNPPDNDKTLGMIVPANASPLSQAGWGVLITYEGDGHVADSDADTIKYDELLKDMQAEVVENNVARKEQGYAAMTLVGWAEAPSYDKVHKKMYWAKEFKSAGSTGTDLNYNIRVLGRQGVLVLNAIANMQQIAAIKQEMKHVTAFTDFTPGNRYADFNASTDKTAEYGLAALVAGGVAAKLGLFGKLFALLLAFKKLIILGVGGIGVAIARFFKGKSEAKVNLEK
ncbi:DUF2167 domain-containing protein [Massilia sp. TSP1-1-2]|uniref:DUF2167 domain-containing protein n=1 Tax=unclassified Massilia TaxID=2609279 RepID=UPI003CF9A98B